MRIMYHLSGMPQEVAETEIAQKLREGLSFENPSPIAPPTPVVSPPPMNPYQVQGSVAGQQVTIPSGEQKTVPGAPFPIDSTPQQTGDTETAVNLQIEQPQTQSPPQAKPNSNQVDINNATLKELTTRLPGMTTAIARRVQNNRPFNTLDDLIKNVEGYDWVAVKDTVFYGSQDDSSSE